MSFKKKTKRGLYHNPTRKLSTKKNYYHCLGEEPLSPLTLGELIELASQRYGDRMAVISCHQNKEMTFKSLVDEADRLAAGFVKLGFQKGDKIGLWAPNLAEWYVSFAACARGGFVAVTMNPYYQPIEMQQLIKKVGLKGLICGDVFRKQNYYELLADICPEMLYCKPGKLYSDKVPSLRNIILITEDNKSGTYKYSDVLNMADVSSINQIKEHQSQIDSDDPCNIQFTSGTTSSPKAAIQTHFSIVNNSYYCGLNMGLHKKQHTICLQNPLFHAFGTVACLSASLNHGCTVVLPNDGYDPDKNLTAIAKQQCTVIMGTPTMYVDLVAKQRERKEDINPDVALTGGALCVPKLFEDMLDVLNVKAVKTIYGLTEVTASAFFSRDGDTKDKILNTVGKLQQHCEAKVVDEKGNRVPFGEPGELLVRGYNVMPGYYNDEEKTKEVIDFDRWFHTGDRFILHEDGYGEIVGRIKDMINRGGENISPKEIEEFLMTHPDIIDVQVVGIPHERLGEEVCAVLKTNNNKPITVEEIHNFCTGKLSSFKIPKVVKIMEYFPTTTSGKIQKYKIIEIVIKNKT